MQTNTKPLAWQFDGECIRCTSHALNSAGYPQFVRSGQKLVIMRSILLRSYRKPPESFVCMHSCDNRWCINPSHLSPGTVAQNNLDAWRRGRQTNDNPFRGVTLHKRSGKWQAQVQTKGAKGYLGLFDTREQAADIAAQKRRELSAQ